MLTIREFKPSSVMFMMYFSASIWMPFFNLYLKGLGLSGTQIGLLGGAFQGTLFIVVPMWGVFTDRFGFSKTLIAASGLTMILVFSTQFILDFHWMIVYIIALSITHHPLGSLSDTIAISHCKLNSAVSYGELRLWGSIGWAAGSIAMGRYLVSAPTVRIFSFAALSFLILMLIGRTFKSESKSIVRSAGFSLSDLRALLRNPRLKRYLLLLTLLGFGQAPIYLFINLYFLEIGASNQLIGWVFALHALSEIPFFIIGYKLVQRYSARRMMILSVCIAVLRMAAYSQITNPVLAMILGISHGVNYSLFWVAVVDLVHRLIPDEWRSTGQSLIWAFHIGLGTTCGNLTIGILSDYLSLKTVMLLGAVFLSGLLIAIWKYPKN